MLLGLRTKSRKDNGVFVEYLISIKEPSHCTMRPFQMAERRKQLTLIHRGSGQRHDHVQRIFQAVPNAKLQKNLLELHVYDAKKKDKGVKNKLLGSVMVNLADYGVLTHSVPVGAPFTFKKSSMNDANSEIYLTIESPGEDDDEGYRSSCSSSQLKMRGSVDKEGSEFSLASLTDEDDDASSQCSSSRRVS